MLKRIISVILALILCTFATFGLTGCSSSGSSSTAGKTLVHGTCSHCHGKGCGWCNYTGVWAYYK